MTDTEHVIYRRSARERGEGREIEAFPSFRAAQRAVLRHIETSERFSWTCYRFRIVRVDRASVSDWTAPRKRVTP